ncbi:MAG: hypothetical protein ACKO2Q_11820, partial [Actinomycetota bacterium]
GRRREEVEKSRKYGAKRAIPEQACDAAEEQAELPQPTIGTTQRQATEATKTAAAVSDIPQLSHQPPTDTRSPLRKRKTTWNG